MSFKMTTTNGYDFYEMASMLQKSIRRGEFELAGFAAKELSGKYRKYLWKRLLVISAEDCYGIITKEIVGLKLADDMCAGKDDVFICKAIVLLCMCLKNRDACYFGCNFFYNDRLLDPKEIPYESFDINNCRLKDDKIPDWVFDCHTLTGKIRGKTINDMIISEQDALVPKQEGMFDNASWKPYLDREEKAKEEKSNSKPKEDLKDKNEKNKEVKEESISLFSDEDFLDL